MKQLVLNLVALAVIGTGGTYLATQPAAAQDATTEAECKQGDIVVSGDKCFVNADGNCECT